MFIAEGVKPRERNILLDKKPCNGETSMSRKADLILSSTKYQKPIKLINPILNTHFSILNTHFSILNTRT